MQIEPQVRPRLQGRDGPAAAQDRPEGHGRRARRPGTEAAGGCRRAATIPVSQTLPDVNLDEILAVAGRRHARLPAAAAQRRRRRALQRQRPRSWRRRIRRIEPTRASTRARSTRRSPSAARNIARVVHNFSLLTDELGRRDTQLANFVAELERGVRDAREPGRDLRATCSELPRRCATTQTTLGKVDDARRRARADAARRCGPAPARSARRCADAAVPARDDADHPRRDPPVHARRAADGQGAAPGAARPRGGHAGPDARRSRSSTALLNDARLQPAGRQRRGLPVLASRGSTTSATRSSPPQDAHGPIRRGLVVLSLPARRSCSTPSPQANPLLGTLVDAAQRARRSRSARSRPRRRGRRLMHKDAPSFGRIAAMVRVRAVVLRAAAVPVARVRRPGAAEAEGLPLHTPRSPRRRSSRRRPTCGSPACRSARSRRSSPTSRPGRSDVDDPARLAYAPLPSDAKAILRQKTLLGETYVELTPGTHAAPSRSPRAGSCRPRRSRRPVELDEILRAFDPKTRARVPGLDADAGAGDRRATGATSTTRSATSAPFAEDTARIVDILNRQEGAVSAADRQHRRRVRRADRARRPAALADRELQHGVRDDRGARRASCRQAFVALPTFERESRADARPPRRSSRDDTNPLVTQLRPAARELSPTLQDLADARARPKRAVRASSSR